MDQLMGKQFELTRGYFLKTIGDFPESNANVQPDGFNNTIHWQIGHVLTVTEQLMFGFPHKTTHLPANYVEMFGTGTKPADWKSDIPSVGELSIQLKDQLERLKQIPSERFDETLKKPFLGLETFGELAAFALFHESNHMGQIHTMKRLIEHAGIKS